MHTLVVMPEDASVMSGHVFTWTDRHIVTVHLESW